MQKEEAGRNAGKRVLKRWIAGFRAFKSIAQVHGTVLYKRVLKGLGDRLQRPDGALIATLRWDSSKAMEQGGKGKISKEK